MNRYRLILALSLIAIVPVQSSCTEVECGDGTIERDGECVGSADITGNGDCGPGTVLENGRCVGATTCDPTTTTEEDQGGGRITCRGSGGLVLPACDLPLPCPNAGQTTTTLCGRLYDIQDDSFIQDSGPPTRCSNTTLAESGACSINVQFYPAALFAQNTSTGELAYNKDDLVRDSCGRFRVTGVAPANPPFTAVGARPGTADRKLTGVIASIAAGQKVEGIRAYSMRTETDTAWTTSAGLAGDSFATRGVYVSIFLNAAGAPQPGVTMVGPTSAATNDYYFTDGDAARTTASATPTSTGANGTGLLIGQPAIMLDAFGGTGPGLEGCYPNVSGGTIRGVVFVQLRPRQCP